MGRANPDPDPDPEKDSYPKEFEELWKARAQRVGSDSKKAAHRAWKARVREGTDPAHLQAAVEQYARSRVGEDPKFTKMLSTYLGPDEHWRADWEIVAMNQAMAGEISGSAYTHRAVMVDCPQCGGHGWTLEAIDRGGLDPEHDRCGTCKGRGKVVAEAVGEAF